MPRVSVVIPTFNRADYVQVAINSVLQQTYRDLEIIICDDGSTDNTLEVVKSIQAGSELPVKVEVLPYNMGVSAARNKAVFSAKGELIAFLDSDDYWKPEKLEKQVAFLDDNPEFIGVGCGFDVVAEDKRINRLYGNNFVLNSSNELFYLLYRCYVNSSTFLVKKEALILSGLFDLRLKTSEDRDLWWRLPKLGRIGYLNESLVACLKHDSNIGNKMIMMTVDTYIPVVRKALWYWKDRLTKKEKHKILCQTHLIISHDTSAGGYYSLSIRHTIMAIFYGANLLPAIKLIMSNFLKFFR